MNFCYENVIAFFYYVMHLYLPLFVFFALNAFYL